MEAAVRFVLAQTKASFHQYGLLASCGGRWKAQAIDIKQRAVLGEEWVLKNG
jgi:hypothetical protein